MVACIQAEASVSNEKLLVEEERKIKESKGN
jgi:hypothetical protein